MRTTTFGRSGRLCWIAVFALAAFAPDAILAQQEGFTEYPLVARYDVRIPMEDGVELSADIYRPDNDGQHPTIFSLTPYNNNSDRAMEEAWSWVRRGYAFVNVDVRGRYDSEGDFDAWRHDSEDGSAVMSWIADQPWSNGEVATIGTSYRGMNQWLMAKQNNPHHAAILGYVAPADGFFDLVRWEGVPKVDLIYTWLMGMYGRVNQSRAGWDWQAVTRNLPLHRLDAVAGRREPTWRNWMTHDSLDAYWEPLQMTGTYDRFDIPSFNVTGWFDGQVQGVTKHFRAAVRTGDPSLHRLIIGPWLHGVNRNRELGERDYGPQAIIALDSIRDAWIDHRMLGAPAPDQPPVLYFLPVKNEWRTARGWPIPGTDSIRFYLDSDGGANTLLGDGTLRRGMPGNGPADHYTYDPSNPVPTLSSRTAGARGGIAQGSVDNRAVETRQDVLVYTSPPLDEGFEMTGPIEATIYVSTDVPDTDITVKLLDVYPDGRALNLSHGIARAKYRNSFRHPEPMQPDSVYGLTVTMYPGSNYFEAGHRVRVEVSSSNFPNLGRNLNHMDSDTGTEIHTADVRVFHTEQYPSHILLPLIPEETTEPWR